MAAEQCAEENARPAEGEHDGQRVLSPAERAHAGESESGEESAAAKASAAPSASVAAWASVWEASGPPPKTANDGAATRKMPHSATAMHCRCRELNRSPRKTLERQPPTIGWKREMNMALLTGIAL